MLLNSSDLGVDSLDARALSGYAANCAGVALERAEDECVDLTLDVPSGLRVCESLVGRRLLQAVDIRDLSEAVCSGGVPEQAEDDVDDARGVILPQSCAHRANDVLM